MAVLESYLFPEPSKFLSHFFAGLTICRQLHLDDHQVVWLSTLVDDDVWNHRIPVEPFDTLRIVLLAAPADPIVLHVHMPAREKRLEIHRQPMTYSDFVYIDGE